MKRHILTLITSLIAIIPLAAQTGYHVNVVFTSDNSVLRKADRVLIDGGDELKQRGLRRYHSISVENNAEVISMIERNVEADMKNASDKEVRHLAGQLYEALLCMSHGKHKYNYIYYRNNTLRAGNTPRVTLIYMEGNLNISQMRQMFKK